MLSTGIVHVCVCVDGMGWDGRVTFGFDVRDEKSISRSQCPWVIIIVLLLLLLL